MLNDALLFYVNFGKQGYILVILYLLQSAVNCR